MKIFPRGISIAGIFLLSAAGLLTAGGTMALINPYLTVIPYYSYLGLAGVCIFLVFLGRPRITYVAGIVLGLLFAGGSPLVIKFTMGDSFDPAIVVSIAIVWVILIGPIIIDRPRPVVQDRSRKSGGELVCDVCGAGGHMVRVGRDDFCNAVLSGFDPFSQGLVPDGVRSYWSDRRAMRRIIGDLAGNDAFQNWKTWVMTVLVDWGLCSSCQKKIGSSL